MFECEVCGKQFTRSDNRNRHMLSACRGKRRKVSDSNVVVHNIKCDVCDENIQGNCYTAHIRSARHRSLAFTVIDDGVKRSVGAFGDRIVSYQVTDMNRVYVDVNEFTTNIREKVFALLEGYLNIHRSVKVNVELYGLYYLGSKENVEIKSFNTRNRVMTEGSNMYGVWLEYVDEISNKMSEFQERDSGWTLVNILYLEVNINKYNPMNGCSYMDLPASIKRKKAVINVQNVDNACFAWAITSALRIPNGLPQRVSSYPHYDTVGDFTQMNFPVSLKEVSLFEEKNNISVNVYGIEERFNGVTKEYDTVGPLHFTSKRRAVHVNLLLASGDDGNSHYCWIKNLSRLVSSQKSKRGHQKYICEGCLVFFTSAAQLDRHENEDCKQVKGIFPTVDLKINKYGEEVPGNLLKFEHFERQLRVPFVVYADFEAILKPISSAEPDPTTSFSVKCFEHIPYSYAYYIKCSFDDRASKMRLYRGEDAAHVFVNQLQKDVKYLYQNYLKKNIEMRALTDDERADYEEAVMCHICEKRINRPDHKVQDHDHMTGCYRGAAHMVCNINYKEPRYIPIVMHNLSNYDTHLFVKSLAMDNEEIDVIPINKEKYVSFSKRVHVGDTIDCNGKVRKVFYKLRFLDSFRFLSSSLQKLSSYLEDAQCQEVARYYSGEKFHQLRQKGVFPYNYISSMERLGATSLPSKDEFYDILNDSHISDEEYHRAQTVWDLFQCGTLGDYSDLYLQSDVLLLTDVFENFRKLCITNYKLDPASYFTAPGLSWDAMLRMTGVQLELLTDADMLHFFKKGIRGGVSMCTKRKEIANNQYLPEFKRDEESKYILYMDATNLYGKAMTYMLPTGDFMWLSREELENIDVMRTSDVGEFGYAFEVDLEYPAELHDLQNDFPFCPEHVVPPGSTYSKLIPNLTDKKNYIMHLTSLKQCIHYGLRLKGIRRGIKFRQSCWLKKYIDFNTEKRNGSTNAFYKQFYKLMVNSIFGKTMENVENRVNIKLVTHWPNICRRLGAEAYIAKPNFKSCKIFSDSLAAIELSQVVIEYMKPVYIGFTILELAKVIMYEFYYAHLKRRYGSNVSLLYTDTDSLIVSVKTNNIYQDIKDDLIVFDTSNFEVGNRYGIPQTSPQLGKMKDEYGGAIIDSFYGTGAKAYCVNLLSKSTKTAKGVKRCVIEKNLSAGDYKDVVENGVNIIRKMYLFRSDFHTVYTELKNKVALSSKDDKRYILPDNVNTLSWGHYRIEEITRDQNLNDLLTALADFQ